MPTISDADLWEVASLVHSKWSDAFDARKATRSETNDGTKDWEQFHKARLEGAEATFKKWSELRSRLMAVAKPLI